MISHKNTGLMPIIFLMVFYGSAGLAYGQAKVANPHGEMDVSCVVCHTEQSWQIDRSISDYDHSGTGFVLEGLHAHALCRDCHQEKVFAHVGTSCADCHDDFHRGRLGVSCEKCHTPEGWVDRSHMQQEHDATALPLVGAHAQVDCDACHSGPVSSQYVGTPSECIACHQDDYDRTTSPDHASAGFGYDCESCHTVFANTWGSGDFRHPPEFPLTGGHGALDCSDCHDSGFQTLPVDCYACHQDDYERADDPDHAGASFPFDCLACHTTVTWEGAKFDHNATAFPLTGAHTPLDCLSCHSAGYTGTPVDCYSCHQPEYESAVDPDHAASAFSFDCLECHTTTTWEGAEYNHAATSFPLDGAHVPLDCSACHSAGYVGTPTDCYACHQEEYDATFDPGHIAAGFPVDCVSCHTTSVWEPSTWDHDILFPIYSGKHGGEWNSCTECHEVPSDYSLYECIHCHEHNQADMDDDHSEENDYQYLSTACFDCHPRGDE